MVLEKEVPLLAEKGFCLHEKRRAEKSLPFLKLVHNESQNAHWPYFNWSNPVILANIFEPCFS